MVASPPRPRRIAIAGNPNSGKTSLFNALTGLRARVANYHGVTVEKREGRLAQTDHLLIDLPGTYSLSARSPDELIARDILLGLSEREPRPDAVVIVIDANNLERNLYLASQIIELGLPTIIACNMMDVAERRGRPVDCKRLSRELGVKVLPTIARRVESLDELRTAIAALANNDATATCPERAFRLPDEIETAVSTVADRIVSERGADECAARSSALLWLTDRSAGVELVGGMDALIAGISRESTGAITHAAESLASKIDDPTRRIIEARYEWIGGIVRSAVAVAPARRTRTDRIDSVLTHRVWGLLIFATVMLLLFLSIFVVAEPVMALIEAGQAGVADVARASIPAGAFQSLIADGLINGVGSVLVFFPQICILFLFLTLLEDSGYIARAAFLMDRLMGRVGLHGRSFIPLLSSYACAIPGILATRTIEHPRDRLATILVAPLMSCSARLPVYLIVIGAVFGQGIWIKTFVLFGLYAMGTIAAFVVALVLKRSLLRGPRPAFLMELPPYHVPPIRAALRTVWDRSKQFLTGAGTTIVAACVVIWALSYFPRLNVSTLPPEDAARLAVVEGEANESARADVLSSLQLRHSAIGHIGRAIEPAIKPLGFDWRLGIGILSSFLAREVFVGTMGITFALGETDETSPALRDQLAGATRPNGERLVTPVVGLSLMIFYVFACQCVSTLAVVRKETGGWKWPAFLFAYMTALAYVASLATFQIGRALGYA